MAACRAREEEMQAELDRKRKECCNLKRDNDAKQGRLLEVEEALEACRAAKLKLQSVQKKLTRTAQDKSKALQEKHDEVLEREQDLIGRVESLINGLNGRRSGEEATRKELERVQRKNAFSRKNKNS